MAIELVVGTTTEGTSNNSSAYVYLARFQASKSANNVTDFRMYTDTGGSQVKIAVYSDNAGSPDALLGVQNTLTDVDAGWDSVSLSSGVNIVAGNYYWLAVTDGNGLVRRTADGTGTVKAKTTGGISGWTYPDPAGSGYTDLTHLESLQLWGEPSGGSTPKGVLSRPILGAFGGMI